MLFSLLIIIIQKFIIINTIYKKIKYGFYPYQIGTSSSFLLGSNNEDSYVFNYDTENNDKLRKLELYDSNAIDVSPSGNQLCWVEHTGRYGRYLLDKSSDYLGKWRRYGNPVTAQRVICRDSGNLAFFKVNNEEGLYRLFYTFSNHGFYPQNYTFYQKPYSLVVYNYYTIFGYPEENSNAIYMYVTDLRSRYISTINLNHSYLLKYPSGDYANQKIILCDLDNNSLFCFSIGFSVYSSKIETTKYFLRGKCKSYSNSHSTFVSQLNDYNVVLACTTGSSSNSMFIIVDYNLIQSGKEISISGAIFSLNTYKGFDMNYASLRDDNNKIEYLYLLNHYTYKDTTVICTNNVKTMIFTELNSYIIQIAILPSSGTVYNNDSVALVYTSYTMNDMYYKNSISGKYDLQYGILPSGYDLYSGIYHVTLIVCYSTCKTCDNFGDSNDHRCLTCLDNNYHFIIDYPTNCITENEKPEKYYLNTTNNRYEPCYNNCGTCTSLGTSTQHQCTKCIINYTHFIKDYPTNCIYENEKPTNYYLKTSTDTYEPCFTLCAKCYVLGNTIKNECTECIVSYYFIETSPTNCISLDQKPNNFYLDKDTNTFRKCFDRCQTCSNGEFLGKHNCIICASGYFLIETYPTNCVLPSEVDNNYYFDSNKQMYRQCFYTCSMCQKTGVNSNHNCDLCIEGYYPLDERRTNCYNEMTKPSNYYLDTTEEIYKKCYETCNSCLNGYINGNHNCLTCNANYYKILNQGDNCIFEGNIPHNYFLDSDNIYKPCYATCNYCSSQGTDKDNKCDQCISQAYSMDDHEGQCVINCPPHYYQDENIKTCIKCYSTCDTCYERGNAKSHKCLKCLDNYSNHPVFIENCIEKIDLLKHNWYLDDEYNYYITDDLKCTSSKPILVKETGQCVESCNHYSSCLLCKSKVLFEYQNYCLDSCPEGFQEDYINNQCNKIYSFGGDSFILNDNSSNSSVYHLSVGLDDFVKQLNESLIFSINSTSKKIAMESDEFTFIVSSTESNETNGYPQIELGECENILKKVYEIDELYVGQLIFNVNNEITGNLKYKVFDKLGNELDLSYCNGSTVTKHKPLNIDLNDIDLEYAEKLAEQGIDIFNPNAEFYSDPCEIYSENGKDIPLSNRKESIYQNVSFCEEGCTYKGIDYITNSVACECEVGGKDASLTSEILNNSPLGEFSEALSVLNLELFKCIHLITIPHLKANIGHWILVSIIVLEILFYISFALFQMNNIYSFLYDKIYLNKMILSNLPKSSPPKKINIQFHDYKSTSINCDTKQKSETDNIFTSQIQQELELEEIPEPEELNEMEYEEALENDKRNYIQIYIDIVKVKQIIIQTITSSNSFYPLFLRIVMLIFTLSIYLFLNALLYDDSYICQRYEAKESLDFMYLISTELEKSIYASIISMIISRILQFLTSSNSEFTLLYKEKYGTIEFESLCKKLITKMKIKQIITLLILIIVNILTWYYISIFCIVNSNNQLPLIQSSCITTSINMLIPIIISLPISIFRFFGLKNRNSLFYKISNIIYELF